MLTVVVANAADLCTFYLVTQIHPLAGESNPIVAPLWHISPLMVAALKIAGVLLALALIRRAHPRIARWGVAIAVVVPLLGTATNTVAGMLA
jgi:hypothetical protein